MYGIGALSEGIGVATSAVGTTVEQTLDKTVIRQVNDNFDKKIAIFSFNYYNKKRHPVSSINLPDVFMQENQERSEHNGKPES